MRKLLLCTLGILGMTGTYATADDKPRNAEKWMFDDKPIAATSPSKGKAEFSINGRLYSRVFYDRALKDVFSLTPTSYQVKVYWKLVDEGSYGMVPIWIPKADFDKTWLDVEVFPDPKTAKTKYGAYGQTFHREFSGDKKYAGKHGVHFEIIVGGGNGEAPEKLADADERAARVTIDFTGHDPKKQAELGQKVAAAGNEAFKSNFSMPKPGALHSAALAKQAEAMTRKGGKEIAQVKVIFTGSDWSIERHELTGRVLSRSASASAVIKSRAGKCSIEPGVIEQKFVGKKFVAPGAWLVTSDTPYQIDCAKAFE